MIQGFKLCLLHFFLQVKIGDFGFAKRLAPGKSSMQVKRITHPRWVAPEVSI
jgi:serine/threonine protein kinase